MVKILNIPLYDRAMETAVRLVEHTCLIAPDRLNRMISATSAHGLVTAKADDEFAEVLDRFFLVLPDGMPSVWIGRHKGAAEMERCYGPDFFRDIMLNTRRSPINHFLCGGRKGVAADLKRNCEHRFRNFNVTGEYSPPFRPMTEKELQSLAGHIEDSKADIVWIGLSTPKQERFANLLSKYINVHFIITVGAAFDFFTDRVTQAPKFIQRAGLEWFFRLCTDPGRLAKRYLKIVPMFIHYNLTEWISSRKGLRLPSPAAKAPRFIYPQEEDWLLSPDTSSVFSSDPAASFMNHIDSGEFHSHISHTEDFSQIERKG